MSELYVETAQRTLARLRTEGVTGNDYQNIVRLSDGTTAYGNRLVTNGIARQIVGAEKERAAAAGADISRWAVPGPESVVAVAATEADRERIHLDTFNHISKGIHNTEEWADIAYKLLQSPQRWSGPDAVIRTYLAGTADYHLGRVPVFPHDIDIRALTMSQSDFVKYVADYDRPNRSVPYQPVE
ncbi:hypothetical protein [Nocardia sp. NPDC057030]|uniref:hypothetical protein n=1 Tax=unclassified Nocardia TaxID=2637762 RepID=UPI00362718D0